MSLEVEQTFKWMDYGARLLGDMKHGINEVRVAGGIGEVQKLEALWGFCEQADEIIKNMKSKINEAREVLNERLGDVDQNNLQPGDAQ